MGNVTTERSVTSQIAWALAVRLSAVLEPTERDAVLGDLQESDERGWSAAAAVAGLATRRVWEVWRRTDPWALAVLLIPVGWGTGRLVVRNARFIAIYLWLYVDRWSSMYLTLPRAREELAITLADALLRCVIIAIVASVCGLAVRTLATHARAVFSLSVFVVVGFATVGHDILRVPIDPFNAVAFSTWPYRLAVPLALEGGLAVVTILAAFRVRPRSDA